MLNFFRDIYFLVQGKNYLGDPLHGEADLSDDKRRHTLFVRGNISLGRGKYRSEDEIERKRKTLARHDFPTP